MERVSTLFCVYVLFHLYTACRHTGIGDVEVQEDIVCRVLSVLAECRRDEDMLHAITTYNFTQTIK